MTILELGKQFRSHFGFNPPIDMIMTMAKGPTNAQIDILKLDKEFERRDSEYNSDECTYKGKENYSMAMYVEEKYGEEACKFICKIM